jgi:exosortase/archaeosortase family protein
MKLVSLFNKSYPFRVILAIAAYYISLQAGFLSGLNSVFKTLTVTLSSGVLSVFGRDIQTIGDIIITKGKSIMVGYGCEGSEPILIYSLAVLAMNGGLRKKLVHILLGSTVLYAMNIGRVVGLVETLIRDESLLDMMHHNVFPGIIAAGVFGIWVFSLKKVGIKK